MKSKILQYYVEHIFYIYIFQLFPLQGKLRIRHITTRAGVAVTNANLPTNTTCSLYGPVPSFLSPSFHLSPLSLSPSLSLALVARQPSERG
jgi:hypothetical protein